MVKVVVAGAAGGIGQPLSLLLKLSPLVDELSLYDVVNSPGVAADLSHIATSTKLSGGFLPQDNGLKCAFTGADMVIIPAGIPRKPGMTRDELFNTNAGIVQSLIQGVADFCPNAFILIISNPVNSTVPIAAETLKAANKFNPQKLFGVTTLDSVRAETFLAELSGSLKPQDVKVPVVGGHSGETIVPLISLAQPVMNLSEDILKQVTKRIQYGGDEVVKAKNGAGSATLSMAYAGFRFAEDLLKAVRGEPSVPTCSYVHLHGIQGGDEIAKLTGCDYFAGPIEFSTSGAKSIKNLLGSANEYEKALLNECYKSLKSNIVKGIEYVKNNPVK